MNILINLKYTLAVTAGVCSSFAYAQKHPHIILIMTDQQRADAIGCMGNDAVISPNLDALACRGNIIYEWLFFLSKQHSGTCRSADRTFSLASWLVGIWKSISRI